MDIKELSDNRKIAEDKINDIIKDLHKPLDGIGRVEVLTVDSGIAFPKIVLQLNILK